MMILGITLLIVLLLVSGLKRAGKLPALNKYFFITALIVLPLALALFFSETAKGRHFNEMRSWQKCEATITETNIVGDRAVLPEFTYTYRVDSIDYKGKTNLGTPPFGGRNKRALTAQAIIKQHPAGSKITIVYNPGIPAQSTSEFRPPWNYYGKTGLATFLFALAAFIMISFLQAKRS